MPDTIRAILEAQKKRHKASREDGWCAACRYPTAPRCIEYRAAVNALKILGECDCPDTWKCEPGPRSCADYRVRLVPDPEAT